MTQEERRNDNGRRETNGRRQNGSSLISSYANYSGVERRVSSERRSASDRRAAAAWFFVSEKNLYAYLLSYIYKLYTNIMELILNMG